MDLQPKTEPGSPPIFSSSGHRNTKDISISELVSVLRADLDRVEGALVARDAKHKSEIGPLQVKVEMERLMRLHAEEELKKKEEQCQKGKKAQESYEALLKELKKNRLYDKSDVKELRKKNRKMEHEILKLMELKKKWVNEIDAVDELRIRVAELESEKLELEVAKKNLIEEKNALNALRIRCGELEDAKKKNLATIEKLRAENCRLAGEKMKAEAKLLKNVSASFGAPKADLGIPHVDIDEDDEELNTMDVCGAAPLQRNKDTSFCPSASEYYMAFRVNPGPQDPSVLEIQEYHVSQHIWKGEPDRILCVRRSQQRKHEDPPQMILPYLEQAGFIGIAHMGYCSIDHHLITSLVERWRPETHTFHMPHGECTITLEDISIISRLPIDGKAVTGQTHGDWMSLCERLLGVQPPLEEISGACLSMSWLSHHFHRPPTYGDSGIYVQQYARAYILQIIGGTLFPDYSGRYVHMMFLPLLEDFAVAGTYSWGSATLAYLYRELCKATNYMVRRIGGACIILQIWAWHRFQRLAPSLVDDTDNVLLHGYAEDRAQFRPLGFHWHNRNSLSDSPLKALHFYRHFFDNLKRDEIIWQPYTKVMANLPDFYNTCADIWRSLVPLIHFHIVEWHQPDRVMLQFGLDQPIPARPHQPDHLHTIILTNRTDSNWPRMHKDCIDMWENRRERCVIGRPSDSPLIACSEYTRWYKTITRRWISPCSANLGGVADIAEQLHTWSNESSWGFNMHKLQQSAKQILFALQEHDRISREQFQLVPPSAIDIAPPEDENMTMCPRRRSGLAATRRRVRADTFASLCQQSTQV